MLSIGKCVSILFLSAVILPGCGFQPQFAVSSSRNLGEDMRYFALETSADRQGQILYQLITEQIRPLSPPRYHARVTMDLATQSVGLSKDVITSRTEVMVTANYFFKPINQGPNQEVQGACHATTYFSTSGTQIYQSVSSERDAHQRAIHQIARCLIDRMVLYVDRHTYSSHQLETSQ